MSRSFTYSALTLRVKASGESNREAWFLTAEEGILRATVFGGPKSRLRAQVAPYHSGTLWIYHDPVRDSRKVSDFDVKTYRTGIRELWERAMASGAVAETILTSQGGGGNWNEALKLAENVLDALETAEADACSRLAVYFLWHWAAILGQRPDLSVCATCSCDVKRDEALWYSAKKEALFCENCMRRHKAGQNAGHNTGQNGGLPAPTDGDSWFRLGPGARLWLSGTETLPAAALSRVSLDNPSLEQAKALTKAVMAGALGRRLSTWDGI